MSLRSVLSLHDTLWRLCKFFHEIKMSFENSTVVSMFIVLLTTSGKRNGGSYFKRQTRYFKFMVVNYLVFNLCQT